MNKNISKTNWNEDYEVEPIKIHDPIAEALTVVDPGEPFVITYTDVVKYGGHSCPTAAGAYRIAQLGLEELYPSEDELPVRSDIKVTAGGSKEDPTYAELSNLISYITGAADEKGFQGIAGGHGGRRNLLKFQEKENEDTEFFFERLDSGKTVKVTYYMGEVPGAGSVSQYLRKIINGEESDKERETFHDAWYSRVQKVLDQDKFFDVEEE